MFVLKLNRMKVHLGGDMLVECVPFRRIPLPDLFVWKGYSFFVYSQDKKFILSEEILV